MPKSSHWTLDDIPWHDLDRARVNDRLLSVVKAAALVERNGADYGAYLANVFADDPAFCALARKWAAEEEQHGLALGKWAELADPTFNFDRAFETFRTLYRIPVEATQSVRGSRAAELCARCVVETGTSSFYSALRDAADEPVLRAICSKIAADEFRHYRLFLDGMARFNAHRPMSLWARLKVAFGRMQEADDDELASAYFAANGGSAQYDRRANASAYSARAFSFYRPHHARRAGHMIAQAVGLNPEGMLARLIQAGMWLMIGFTGRKYRSA